MTDKHHLQSDIQRVVTVRNVVIVVEPPSVETPRPCTGKTFHGASVEKNGRGQAHLGWSDRLGGG